MGGPRPNQAPPWLRPWIHRSSLSNFSRPCRLGEKKNIPGHNFYNVVHHDCASRSIGLLQAHSQVVSALCACVCEQGRQQECFILVKKREAIKT